MESGSEFTTGRTKFERGDTPDAPSAVPAEHNSGEPDDETAPDGQAYEYKPVKFLSMRIVCRAMFASMAWPERRLVLAALLSAILYSAGTAALPLLIKLPMQETHRFVGLIFNHFTVIAILTGIFLARPLFLRWHVRWISKALRRQQFDTWPFHMSLGHETLLTLTRDVPLLLLLTGSLAINLGIWTLAAAIIIFFGIYLAIRNVKHHRRHRVRKAKKKRLDSNQDYLLARNARADTEAISDLPQSLLVGGVILWFGYNGENLTDGLVASLVINLMLAAPPIRRLTKLYAKVALKTQKGVTDDEEE